MRTASARYQVLVERGLLARAGRLLDKVSAGRPWVVVTDKIVWKNWGRALGSALAPRSYGLLRIPPGEQQKNFRTAELLCEQLVRQRADRNSLLIGFGGGVIGDLTSFVASVFLRGVDYVHIPTTLLAQIDSSVGGKTGVNLRSGKNLVGTFYQPRQVLADPEVLRTLPARELRAGLYEAVKAGIILDKGLFEFVEQRREDLLQGNPDRLAELVRRSVAIKAWVVARDEKESGLRRILNLGHTVGHAPGSRDRLPLFPAWRSGRLGPSGGNPARRGTAVDCEGRSRADPRLGEKPGSFAAAGSRGAGEAGGPHAGG